MPAEDRAAAVSKLLQVGERLRKLGNFQSFFTVASVLSQAAISRLALTFAL